LIHSLPTKDISVVIEQLPARNGRGECEILRAEDLLLLAVRGDEVIAAGGDSCHLFFNSNDRFCPRQQS